MFYETNMSMLDMNMLGKTDDTIIVRFTMFQNRTIVGRSRRKLKMEDSP